LSPSRAQGRNQRHQRRVVASLVVVPHPLALVAPRTRQSEVLQIVAPSVVARLDVLHGHARLRVPIGRDCDARIAVNAPAYPGSLPAHQPRLERGIGRNDGQHAVTSGDSHRSILLSTRFESKRPSASRFVRTDPICAHREQF